MFITTTIYVYYCQLFLLESGNLTVYIQLPFSFVMLNSDVAIYYLLYNDVGYYLPHFSFALVMRIWPKHLKLIIDFHVTAELDFHFSRNDIACLVVRERHSEEYCAMYNICGERSDGKALNCPYGSPSVKVYNF